PQYSSAATCASTRTSRSLSTTKARTGSSTSRCGGRGMCRKESRMNMKTSPLARICMFLLAATLLCGVAVAQATLDDLLGRMPADSTAEADDASAQFVALGPD